MRILFMVLPYHFTAGKTVIPPLGLQYIMSNFDSSNHDCMFFDPNLYEGKNLLEYIFSNIYKSDADIIAITCNFSYQSSIMQQILNLIKGINPNKKTVAGGNHLTSFYRMGNSYVNLDKAILGEGESEFDSYINQKNVEVKDINELNMPLRKDIIMEQYFNLNLSHDQVAGGRVVNMISSRGCPYNCLFCSVRNIWGKKFRPRTPKLVVDEIEWIVNNLNATEIHFEDDNIVYDRDRIIEICELIIARDIRIKWTCPNGMDLSKLDYELVSKMIEAGLYRITICPESMNDRILKIYRKHFRTKQIKEKTDMLKQFNIERVGYFIIAEPSETVEEMKRTLDYADENFDSYDVSFLSPYIGTDLYKQSMEKGLINNRVNFAADYKDNFIITEERRKELDSIVDYHTSKRKERYERQKITAGN